MAQNTQDIPPPYRARSDYAAAMDSIELAFAGAAEQARMLAAGAVTAPALTELYLDRIARLDPELRVLPGGVRRCARAEAAAAAQERLDAGERLPLLGVPDRDQGRRRRRRRGHHLRQQRARPGADQGRRGGAPAAGGGCGDPRQDRGAGDDDLAVHRDGDLRRHAQSVGHRPHAGRQQRRQRCRGGRRVWRRSRWAPTARARSGSRRPGAACSASSRSATGCRWPRTTTRGAG